MAREKAVAHKPKCFIGGILVTAGFLAILADLSFLTTPLARLVDISKQGFLGLVPSLGLSLIHAAGAIALHQVDYFSLISRILVLFFALAAIVIGVALLKVRTMSLPAQNRKVSSTSDKGDR